MRALESLIDSFAEQLSQVFMLRVFAVGTKLLMAVSAALMDLAIGNSRLARLGEMMAKPVRIRRL